MCICCMFSAQRQAPSGDGAGSSESGSDSPGHDGGGGFIRKRPAVQGTRCTRRPVIASDDEIQGSPTDNVGDTEFATFDLNTAAHHLPNYWSHYRSVSERAWAVLSGRQACVLRILQWKTWRFDFKRESNLPEFIPMKFRANIYSINYVLFSIGLTAITLREVIL